jgi:hypothetical protein
MTPVSKRADKPKRDRVEEEKEFANHYYHEALSVAYLRALRAGVELKVDHVRGPSRHAPANLRFRRRSV